MVLKRLMRRLGLRRVEPRFKGDHPLLPDLHPEKKGARKYSIGELYKLADELEVAKGELSTRDLSNATSVRRLRQDTKHSTIVKEWAKDSASTAKFTTAAGILAGTFATGGSITGLLAGAAAGPATVALFALFGGIHAFKRRKETWGTKRAWDAHEKGLVPKNRAQQSKLLVQIEERADMARRLADVRISGEPEDAIHLKVPPRPKPPVLKFKEK